MTDSVFLLSSANGLTELGEQPFPSEAALQDYQVLQDVAGFKDLIVPPASISYYDNIDGANAYGFESEISYQHERNKASMYVAWNGFQTDQPEQETRSYYPAEFKFGATGRVVMGEAWTLNANYAFTSTTHRESVDNRVPVIHSLDVSASYRLCKNAELQVGINDLFDRTGSAVRPLGAFTAHETPGRTIYTTIRVHF